MIENHPFEPWLPSNAHLLMLGTFPPSPKRWCIPWYYPNYQNDMWRIFGLIFFGDKLHFVDAENKRYREEELKSFLQEKGVAIYDTAQKVIRTKNTASDKDLQVVEIVCSEHCPNAGLCLLQDSWPPASSPSITALQPLRLWEAMWSSVSMDVFSDSIACRAAAGLIP